MNEKLKLLINNTNHIPYKDLKIIVILRLWVLLISFKLMKKDFVILDLSMMTYKDQIVLVKYIDMPKKQAVISSIAHMLQEVSNNDDLQIIIFNKFKDDI